MEGDMVPGEGTWGGDEAWGSYGVTRPLLREELGVRGSVTWEAHG